MKIVDQMPSSPACASRRYGYQTTPQKEAPARSAQRRAARWGMVSRTCVFYTSDHERLRRPARHSPSSAAASTATCATSRASVAASPSHLARRRARRRDRGPGARRYPRRSTRGASTREPDGLARVAARAGRGPACTCIRSRRGARSARCRRPSASACRWSSRCTTCSSCGRDALRCRRRRAARSGVARARPPPCFATRPRSSRLRNSSPTLARAAHSRGSRSRWFPTARRCRATAAIALDARAEFLARTPAPRGRRAGRHRAAQGQRPACDELPAHLEGTDIARRRDRLPRPAALSRMARASDALRARRLRRRATRRPARARTARELVLFPNRVPESFSYALSDAWAAGLPGARRARRARSPSACARHGGGWLLPRRLRCARGRHAPAPPPRAARGRRELARVKSALAPPDPARIPTLDDMARSLDAFYRRFGDRPARARCRGRRRDRRSCSRRTSTARSSARSSCASPTSTRRCRRRSRRAIARRGVRTRVARVDRQARARRRRRSRPSSQREVAAAPRPRPADRAAPIHKDAFDLLPGDRAQAPAEEDPRCAKLTSASSRTSPTSRSSAAPREPRRTGSRRRPR